MSTCATCNGWGVILSYRSVAPSTAEKRMEARRQHQAGTRPLMVIEISCSSCAGFGNRPNAR